MGTVRTGPTGVKPPTGLDIGNRYFKMIHGGGGGRYTKFTRKKTKRIRPSFLILNTDKK